MKRTWLVTLLLCTPSLAWAQNVSVDFVAGADAQQAADFLGTAPDEFAALLEGEIADALGLLDTEQYLQPFADAQAFSSKGLTVDYASEFGALLVGFGVSTAFAYSGDLNPDNIDRAVDGLAPNLSALVGVDLGILGLDGLRIFASGYRQDASFGDSDEFDLKVDNLGFHAQLRLFGGDGDSTSEVFWDWRGFDITAGYNRARTTLTLTEELPTSLTLGSGGQQLDVDLSSVGLLRLDARTSNIPVEITTAVTLLSVLTLYGGVGTDLQLGDATIEASLDGTVTAENPQGGDTLDIGTVDIDADQAAKPTRGRFRTMLGLQASLWVLKAYVQLNALPGVAASVAGGVRVAF